MEILMVMKEILIIMMEILVIVMDHDDQNFHHDD